MALDRGDSLYLGRPCYHGLAQAPGCASSVWTHERYSEAVVSSMETALRRIISAAGTEHVVWIGYSGGGTLVMLLAPRFAQTRDVVTIAANLDIDAWADLHRYARLIGSLNPARQPAIPARIRQRHYVGGRDEVVPWEVVMRGRVDPATIVVVRDFDHVCCWEVMWPQILATLADGT